MTEKSVYEPMKSNPLISVIMTNYNYESYLEQSIRSVLSQSYGHFELIIVDDGSTDGSRSIIHSFTDPRIKTVFQVNQGQAAAFNIGFRKSKGKIICFLDSDDYWYPQKLAAAADHHREFDFVQHNLHRSDTGQLYRKFKYYTYHRELMTEFGLLDFFVPTSGLSFTRRLLERIFPLPEIELKICADAYITRMALYYGQLKCLDEPLGCYRINHHSYFMDQPQPIKAKIIQNVLELIHRKNEQAGHLPIPFRFRPKKDVVARGYADYNLASQLEQNGQLEQAASLFKETMKIKLIELKYGSLFHLGVIHLAKKDYIQARQYFSQCLLYEPDHQKARQYLEKINNEY
jgi:glycosyltransferase involved in cell wall biosynthesis